MQYVVWVDSGPQLVTPELVDAIDAAKRAIGRSSVSRFTIAIPQDPFAAVIYWRKPDRSSYTERWIDTLSQQSYEATKEKAVVHAHK
jgi:hypothetical protein